MKKQRCCLCEARLLKPPAPALPPIDASFDYRGRPVRVLFSMRALFPDDGRGDRVCRACSHGLLDDAIDRWRAGA